MSVGAETVEDWKHSDYCKKLKVIYIMPMRPVYFSVYNIAKPSLFEEIFDGIKSKQWVIVLTCNADGSDKLPPLVTGKYKSPCCFKNVKRLPTKYEANTNFWMTT
jgi:hypothetical protein